LLAIAILLVEAESVDRRCEKATVGQERHGSKRGVSCKHFSRPSPRLIPSHEGSRMAASSVGTQSQISERPRIFLRSITTFTINELSITTERSFHARQSNQYDNPLISRYASPEMSRLWSPQRKFSTWRRLWVALAEPRRNWDCRSRRNRSHNSRRSGRHRLRGRRALRAKAAARRDGSRTRLRRPLPRRPSHHPPGRHELLRHRQHRPAAAARGLADDRSPRCGRDRRAGRLRRNVSRPPCLGFTHLQPAQRRPSANGPVSGRTISRWTWPKSSTASAASRPWAQGHYGTQASFLQLFHGDHARCGSWRS